MSPVSETYWGIPGYVIFWVLFAIAFGLFAQRFYFLFRLLLLGKQENRFDRIGERIKTLASIEDFFRRRNRSMNPSIRKQAMLPDGAEVLFNPVGTAPGFQLRIGSCRFFFLPGVPFEMKRMLADHVLPRMATLLGGRREARRVKLCLVSG